MAVSSQITASTGITCSIEPRNTRSSNVQNPKYYESTRCMGSVNNDILPELAVRMNSIGPWILSVSTRSVSSIARQKYLSSSP